MSGGAEGRATAAAAATVAAPDAAAAVPAAALHDARALLWWWVLLLLAYAPASHVAAPLAFVVAERRLQPQPQQVFQRRARRPHQVHRHQRFRLT